MSSCKFWKERGRSNGLHKPHPDSGCQNQRRMPPLLRLDSTGEISSARLVKPGKHPKCYNEKQQMPKAANQLSFKGLFDGLGMTTVIESANACIGTAASYLEDFCNSNSRRSLVRSDSDTTALQYLHNMLKNQHPAKGKDYCGSFDSGLAQDNCCNKPAVNMDQFMKSPVNNMQAMPVAPAVSNSIFGVLQNSFSNCNTMKSKPEPYIPPHLKHRTSGANRNTGAMFDPKLTPYNARLLARSKNQRPNMESANHQCQKENKPTEHRSSTNIMKSNCERAKSPMLIEKTASNVASPVEVTKPTETSNCDNASETSLSDPEPSDSDIVNDWFDYENNNFDASPVPCTPSNGIQCSASKSGAMSCGVRPSESPISGSPPLHNWHSVEFDVDVQKAAENNFHSSQGDGSQISPDDPKPDKVPQNVEESGSENIHVNNANISNVEKKQPASKPESVCIFPSILYVRNLQNSRKCRPSSKKRRRQKGQPTENNTSKDKKTSSAKSQTGSVAFILGIEPENGQASSHPFLISCDTDSSSDWSDDSDLEVDEIDGDSMKDLCSFNNPLSLFNLEVMCSLHPTSPSPCSTIDAINLSWQVNISMDADDKQKKKTSSSKKVSFVEDKDLETVHNMVAWSYAYAAARKGPWEEIARDRGRFLRRITDGEKLLAPILDGKHRDRVFQMRFQTDCSN